MIILGHFIIPNKLYVIDQLLCLGLKFVGQCLSNCCKVYRLEKLRYFLHEVFNLVDKSPEYLNIPDVVAFPL